LSQLDEILTHLTGPLVEEVLKRKVVSTTRNRKNRILREVEEVLKRKVVSTSRAEYTSHLPVEEVLNNKL
jgi:flagellar motor switch protein FliG